MDLITNTWNTSEQAPLANGLIFASIAVAVVGIIAFMLTFDKTHPFRKIVALTIGVATAAALAIMIPISYSLPRVETPNTTSSIEATGTIDTITPNLNRGGTGIRLTENPEILLVISEDESDTFAGLQGHNATLYCATPRDLDQDNPALAAGTILDCGSTPNPSNNPVYATLLINSDIPDDAQTTTTAITIVDEPNQ